MANFYVYTIFDSKAEVYSTQLFLARTDAEAARSVCAGALSNPDSFHFKYATDYSLFRIGRFSELSGDLSPLNTPACVVHFWELLGDSSKVLDNSTAELDSVDLAK